MGLIKALSGATTTALGDQFKEFVTCPTISKNVLIQRGIVNHGMVIAIQVMVLLLMEVLL